MILLKYSCLFLLILILNAILAGFFTGLTGYEIKEKSFAIAFWFAMFMSIIKK